MVMFNPTKMTRQNTLDFKAPEPNPIVQKVFKLILPFILNNVLGGLRVEIDPTSLNHLKATKGQRCLLLPNHPSEWDPCVMFDVAKKLDENFFFVAAREVFDYSFGIRGWFFQKLGVYSLVRGSNDRKSLKTSIETLAQNKGRLVIFIEGEISNQNQTLLPLESGVIQLAFMALNDAYKENGKSLEKLPSLYVCPVGLRYDYDEHGLQDAVEVSISSLEEATGTACEGSMFDRVVKLATVALHGTANQFGFALDEQASMGQNVNHLSGFMLTKLEQVINLAPNSSMAHLDRIRQIRNTVDKILSEGDKDENTLYAKRLFLHQKGVLQHFYNDLDRVVNFIAIYDGYLKPDMKTAEYVEILRRLEKEVFGHYRLVHPRVGKVCVQEPIDLKQHFEAFMSDKKSTTAHLAKTVEQHIFDGINRGIATKD